MEDAGDIVEKLGRRLKNLPFSELVKVCDRFFGDPRQKRTSHRVYRTPWPGDPRVNIQSDEGMAKPYQVRQVIKAIVRLQEVVKEENKVT